MLSEETLSASTPEPLSAEKALRQETAILILLGSALLGMTGNLFFFDNRPGLNVLLFVLMFITGAVGLLTYFKRTLNPRNMVFMLPAVFFGAMLVLFTAPLLVAFNVVIVFGSLFLFLRYATHPRFIGGSWFAPVLAIIESSIIGWLEGPLQILNDSLGWLKRQEIDNERAATFSAVLRGLLLTIPIILVFGILLGSADIVFGDLLAEGLNWFNLDVDSLVGRLIMIGIITWLCMAGYKLLMFGTIAGADDLLDGKAPRLPTPLGMIESGMVLASVDALFLFFVFIQARYLFGGEANITAQGYTYSDYARRGFFEILAVSFMTLVLILLLDSLTHRKQQAQHTLFNGLSIGLIVLTLVLLVAAFQRLVLYEDAYGFTRLRVMTQVFIIWLACLFTVIMAALWRQQRDLFWLGCLVVALGFIGTLNLMNMDAFIASQNIARFEATGKLDGDYLMQLSDDAIPVIAPLLDHPDLESSEWGRDILSGLGEKLYWLELDREERDWLGYHYSKDRAWTALEPYREQLAPYMRPSYAR